MSRKEIERIGEDRERKAERSIPVSARVDVVVLVKCLDAWERRGVRVKSMSQLISWSLDNFANELVRNGIIEERELSYLDAYRILESTELLQRSMVERNRSKHQHSVMFESMRNEGYDPGMFREQFNTMHKNRIEVSEFQIKVPYESSRIKCKDEEILQLAIGLRKKKGEEVTEEIIEEMIKGINENIEREENERKEEFEKTKSEGIERILVASTITNEKIV